MSVPASFASTGAAVCPAGSGGKRTAGVYHRRFSGAFRGCDETLRLSFELFAHDISSPADAGDLVGADLQKLSDQRGGALSQIKICLQACFYGRVILS